MSTKINPKVKEAPKVQVYKQLQQLLLEVKGEEEWKPYVWRSLDQQQGHKNYLMSNLDRY